MQLINESKQRQIKDYWPKERIIISIVLIQILLPSGLMIMVTRDRTATLGRPLTNSCTLDRTIQKTFL
jgi:hypothetical protein